MVRRAEEAGTDALELDFWVSPRHERERGREQLWDRSPKYTEMITSWVKEAARIPVIVKLTPTSRISRSGARLPRRGGADAVSLINTIGP